MSKTSTPRVTSARYVDGYRIALTFADGKRGIVDLKDELWGEAFVPLEDVKLFRAFRVDRIWATLVWPTGADLAPEFLHERAKS